MSEKHEELLNCQKCGAAGKFTVWDSVDGSNEYLKERLLSGELFTFTCPKCGHAVQVSYFMLYYDMKKHLLLNLLGGMQDGGSPAAAFFAEHSAELGQLNYIQRLVTEQNALREKAMLFEYGLDDRIVELIKVMYLQKIAEEHPEIKVEGAYYFRGGQGENCLLFQGGGRTLATISIDQNDLYRQVCAAYAPQLPALAEDKTQVIDGSWAVNFLNRQ